MIMKFAVSNIAWPTEKRKEILPLLKQAGVSAVELAPTKIWPDIFKVTQKDTDIFLREIEKYELKVAGFHALLYGKDDLSIFGNSLVKKFTMDYLVKLAEICSLLGGKNLVFGSPGCRRRGNLTEEKAQNYVADFFHELSNRCKELNVVFVIEPLGSSEADFINSVVSALQLIHKVGHPGFQGHLDAKSLAEAGEINEATFMDYKPVLKHFHVNDSDLEPLDANDRIGHKRMGRLLKDIGYKGYISLEQRATPVEPIEVCMNSIRLMKGYYDVSGN